MDHAHTWNREEVVVLSVDRQIVRHCRGCDPRIHDLGPLPLSARFRNDLSEDPCHRGIDGQWLKQRLNRCQGA